MEQVLVELLKTINSQDSQPSTINWAKSQFEQILLNYKKLDKEE